MTSIDVVPDAVVVVDHAGCIVEANPALAALPGSPSAGELLGEPAARTLGLRWVGGAPVEVNGTVDARALHGRRLVVGRPDGTDVVVDASTAALPDGPGAVVALREASARADSGAVEIVATVSHELRSPLTSIKGFTSLLLDRWDRIDDERKRVMLEQVNHDADRVTRMITELLDISRLETGRLHLRRQLVDMPDLAATVAAKVAVAHPELDCEIGFPSDFPTVLADPDKVTQVVTNLVENAAKYGSAEVTVEGTVVAAPDGAAPEAVEVTVRDHGDGISAHDLPLVFERFFRRDHGRPDGTGLGLWISRGLVEAHGGSLTARSRAGQGSTFSFTLPLVDLDELRL